LRIFLASAKNSICALQIDAMSKSAIIGSILGTAVGDALGLPYERLSRRRGMRLFGPPDRYRFFFGRGMVSDDTEHTCMVAQALIASDLKIDRFRKKLVWSLRFWLIGLPAGIGRATLLSCIKLCLGVPSTRSGIFSAGNGPAMRSAVLGAAVADRQILVDLVRASMRVTHTDPKAEFGARAVAVAARLARDASLVSGQHYLDQLRNFCPEQGATELISLIEKVIKSVSANENTLGFAQTIGQARGISGYIYHTVPVVIHAWLSSPTNFRAAIQNVINCGGDTDTTAAILGGILGAGLGPEGIPKEWLERLWEWPRSVAWMRKLGECLANRMDGDKSCSAPRPWMLLQLLRNVLFLLIVFAHIARRALPPY
jgi:ADP-ribosylglycohydrolase